MHRGAFAAVLSCTVLVSVEPAYAECRTALPPTAERAGYWQYHVIDGRRCWFGPLKAAARAQARIIMATPKPVRTTTGMRPTAKPPVLGPMPAVPVVPPDDDDEIWPKPDANFDQRFDALRDGHGGARPKLLPL